MADSLSNEVLERMLDAAPDAVVAVRVDGVIVYTNAQVCELFGYDEGELIGQTIEVLVPARFGHIHTVHRARYVDSPVARPMGEGLELYARRKDGSEFPVEISLSPLQTEEGRVVSAAIRDVSERKRAQADLNQARAELQQRELARRHAVDINDNVIQGLTVALYEARRAGVERVEDALRAALDEARRIVDDLQGDQEIEAGALRRGIGVPDLRRRGHS